MKLLCALTMLAIGLHAPLAYADPELAKTADQKLDDITKGLGRIESKLDEIAILRTSLDKLRGDLAHLQTEMNIKVQSDKATIKELQDRIADLEKKVTDQVTSFQKKLDELSAPSSVRVMRSPPNPATGRIRLVNNFEGLVTIVVNGKPYALPPRQSAILEDQPVGSFNYEVLANGFGLLAPGRVTSTVAANQTVTVEVYTRP